MKAILSPVKQVGHKALWLAALAVTKQLETDFNQLFNTEKISNISKEQMQQLQSEDPVISKVIQLKKHKTKLSTQNQKVQSTDVRKLLSQWPKLEINDDILYRRNREVKQLVLPSKLRCLI